jgi:hypothetical protein
MGFKEYRIPPVRSMVTVVAGWFCIADQSIAAFVPNTLWAEGQPCCQAHVIAKALQ